MKRRWKKFLAGVLSAALALNLAAPLALADGVACRVTKVFVYPDHVGRVNSVNVNCIQGEVSYDHGLLTFQGDVTLTTVGVADFGTVPLVEALSEKNLRLAANGKVTGRTKGNGIEKAKEIAGGEYDLTYADLGKYSVTKPIGILGGDTGTTITAGTEITLKDFHTGIGGGDVRPQRKHARQLAQAGLVAGKQIGALEALQPFEGFQGIGELLGERVVARVVGAEQGG